MNTPLQDEDILKMPEGMEEEDEEHSAWILPVLTLLIVIVVVVTVLLYFYSTQYKAPIPEGGPLSTDTENTTFTDAHLIPGVPYVGVYTGMPLGADTAASVAALLAYWGDNRFSPGVVAHSFASQYPTSPEDEPEDIIAITRFFERAGYILYAVENPTQDDIRAELRAGNPVILRQRPSLGTLPNNSVRRIYIGFSDTEGSFVTHDAYFGNNFPISYYEFEQLSTQNDVMLTITPGKNIAAMLPGPDTSYEYPSRLSSMDDESMTLIQNGLLTIEGSVAQAQEAGESRASIWEGIIAEEAFTALHRKDQVDIAVSLAELYLETLNRPAQAVTVLERVVLPILNTDPDFTEPYKDFGGKLGELSVPEWYTAPWTTLGRAYEAIGDTAAAQAAFAKAE